MKTGLIGAVAILMFGGCRSPGPVEHRLIGTWESPALYWVGNNASVHPLSHRVMEVTFTPDKKELWRYRGEKAQTVGRWHLDGSDLVFTLESPGGDAPAGTTRRERIKSITWDKLVFTDGDHDSVWTRIQ